jgi:hypothetical protein
MKSLVFVTLAVFLFGGCSTARHSEEISKKRQEIEVLREEIVIAIKSLDHLQRELAAQGGYPTKAQGRDLEYFVSVIRDARDKLTAEDRRIHQQYGVSYGPY